MIKNSVYNQDWQENRIKFILSLFEPSFFKGKNILELGAFHGDIGNYFAEELGANVTSVEGSLFNYETMCNKYSKNITCIFDNLDTKDWRFGKYDIIINFGLFYHLEKYHFEHLSNCINNCEILFLESVVFDFDEDKLFFREESGIDQSLSNKAGIPTAKYVENIFKKQNLKFKRYDDQKLDSGAHKYSWIEIDSGESDGYQRRFWVVKK